MAHVLTPFPFTSSSPSAPSQVASAPVAMMRDLPGTGGKRGQRSPTNHHVTGLPDGRASGSGVFRSSHQSDKGSNRPLVPDSGREAVPSEYRPREDGLFGKQGGSGPCTSAQGEIERWAGCPCPRSYPMRISRNRVRRQGRLPATRTRTERGETRVRWSQNCPVGTKESFPRSYCTPWTTCERASTSAVAFHLVLPIIGEHCGGVATPPSPLGLRQPPTPPHPSSRLQPTRPISPRPIRRSCLAEYCLLRTDTLNGRQDRSTEVTSRNNISVPNRWRGRRVHEVPL